MKKANFTKLYLAVLSMCLMTIGLTAQTFPVSSPGAIADAGASPTLFDIPVSSLPGGGVIGEDVFIEEVNFNITHTWANDLDIFLVSPSGARFELTTDNGGLTGFDTPATLRLLEEQLPANAGLAGVDSWGGGIPSAAGFLPEGGSITAALAGEAGNGNWVLEVGDDAGGDVGTLNSGNLVFSALTASITCPADQTVSMDPNFCGVVTANLPQPVVTGGVPIDLVITLGGDQRAFTCTGSLQNSIYTLSGAPIVSSNVIIDMTTFADNGAGFEVSDVLGPDGSVLGDSPFGCGDCNECSTTFTVPAGTWNTWVTTFGPDLDFTWEAAGGVNCFCNDTWALEVNIPTGMTVPFTSTAMDSVFGSGVIPIEYCAQDPSGILVCCTTNYTVEDLVAPAFTACPADQVYNLLPGECDIIVSWSIEATDNCPEALVLSPLGEMLVTGNLNCANGTSSQENRHFRLFTPLFDLRVDSIDIGIAIDAGGKPLTVSFWDNTDGAFPAAVPTTNVYTGPGFTTPGNANATTRVDVGGAAGFTLLAGVEYVLEVMDPGGAGTLRLGYNSANAPTWLFAPVCGAAVPAEVNTLVGGIGGLVMQLVTKVGGVTVADCTTNPFVSGDLIEVGSHDFCYSATDDNNNVTLCEFNITVNSFPDATTTLACNDNVQISLDEDNSDCTLVNADVVLEGGPYGCYRLDYTLTRTPAVNGCRGIATDDGEVLFNCNDIGSAITVRVTDNNTGSSCWGTVTVEDKISPVITCPDQSVDCNEATDPVITVPPAQPNTTLEFEINPNTVVGNNWPVQTWTIPVSGMTDLTDVDFFMDINSTDGDDFNIDLTSPQGTTIRVFGANCFGNVGDMITTYGDGNPAFTCPPGALSAPTQALSAFNGEDANGDWTITTPLVFTTNNAGEFRNFNLILTGTAVLQTTVDANDNCGIASLDFVDATASGTCTDGTVGSISRTWTATDASGNATRCTQIITIDRPTLGDVTFPEGTTILDCSSDYPNPGVEVCVKDTVAFALGLGLPEGPTAATFDGNDLNSLVVASFDIEADADASRKIKDLNIAIELTHADISEAQIAIARLNANGDVIANSVVVLYTADVADGYVQCSNSIQNSFEIIFDDEGCEMPHEPCTDFLPAIKGQFKPFQALSAFEGQLLNQVAGDDYAILYRDLEGPSPANTTNGIGQLVEMEIIYLYQDADVIEVPTIAGNSFASGDICGLTSTYTDSEPIDVCAASYKLIRTWTVIDWCSGDKTVTDQLIKVIDNTPPVLDVPNTVEDDRFTLDINVYQPSGTNSGAHNVCMGDAVLPPLDICSENCSGVDAASWTTELHSADGATLLGVVAGNGGTFRDLILDLDEGPDDDKAPGILRFPNLSTPNPFDTITIRVDSETLREPDAIYLAKYKVADNCGNTAEAEVFIRLLDKIPPVPVVREETQLALTGGAGDTTALCAADLDEASYDNCGGTHFFIRKMLDADDTDPICNLDFGFGPDPTLTFEIFGKDGNGVFDLARECVYKSCTSFTCADIGTDNQVFVLVVDDYVINFINDYLDSVFEFIDAIVDYSLVPLTILPDDTYDDQGDAFIFRSLDDFDISVDRDRRNGGQRNFEFYLNEDPRADGLFIIPTALVWEGHFNFAMVNVHVEDKVRPECHAPEDVWTTCDKIAGNSDLSDAATLDGLFGTATATDNCNATLEERAPTVNVDLCGVGTVTRNWIAEDDYSNRSLGRCRQTIMIMPVNEYTITVPGDFEEECDDASPADLTYEEIGCDLLAVSREVEEFPVSTLGECKKMVITWKVINWCEYDGSSAPVELPRQNFNTDNLFDSYSYASNGTEMTSSRGNIVLPSTGYYSYIQHVKIFDNTAPDVSYDGDTTFCGGDQDEDPCTGPVEIDPTRSDLCTSTSMTWELDAFSDSFNEADFDGDGALSTRLPLGTHTVRFYVDDECGNTSYLTVTFTVVDCKAPTPVCHNGLSIDVMPLSGMVELWASDFDASSFDYCSPYVLRINIVEDGNNDGVINADDYVNTLPSSDNIILDCDDVAAGLTMVQLWVAEQDGDDDDNAMNNQDNDYCVTFVEVQDNNGVCSSSSKVALGGKIANEQGESVEAVTVEINNGSSSLTSSMVTDASGEYDFRNLPLGGDYTVAPMRLDEVSNGVTTFDLIKISRHILNVELLDSPYKIIAADANNSANISTVDLIAIRKVILRVADEFPNNTSWRFVDKGYTFANAAQPLAENFAEIINRNNLDSPDFAANFVAIKIGDVNGDATPNSILGVDGRTFNGNMILNASEQSVEAGEEFTVEFTAGQDVDGYQFTLDYNEKAVELVDVVDGLATEAANFNVAEGQIATSWNQDVSTKGQVMFSLVFRAKDAIEVSNVMSVNSAITAAEAYGVNGELMGISLEFDGAEATAQFELAQNTPNPFKTETVIGFTLPEASNATLTVSDVTGKVLKVVTGDFAKGYNQVSMKRADLGVATGVLSYRLEANGNTATKQMIVIE